MRQTKALAGSGQNEALLSLTIWAGLFRQKFETLASPISYQKNKIRTFSLWCHLTTTSDPELPSIRIAKFEWVNWILFVLVKWCHHKNNGLLSDHILRPNLYITLTSSFFKLISIPCSPPPPISDKKCWKSVLCFRVSAAHTYCIGYVKSDAHVA